MLMLLCQFFCICSEVTCPICHVFCTLFQFTKVFLSLIKCLSVKAIIEDNWILKQELKVGRLHSNV